MWKSKYLRRLLQFSIILVTIPILTLGLLSYLKAQGIIQEKVVLGNMQVLHQTELKVEQLLQTIDYSITQFGNSSNVLLSIRSDLTARDFVRINDLNESLHKLQYYDAGIENIQLVSFPGRWSLDNSGFVRSLSDEEIKPHADLVNTTDISRWVTSEGGDSVQLIKKLPINTVKHPAAVLELTLPSSKLQKLLPEKNPDSVTIILDEKYQQLTQVKNSLYTGDTLNRLIDQLRTMEGTEGFSTFRFGQKSIGMSYRISPYNGWVYVSLVSIGQITKESRAIGWYTLGICIAVFLIVLALSLIGTRRMYKPIRSVFEAVVSDGEDSSSHEEDELQVISDRIRSLKRSQSNLFEKVRGQTKQLQELFVLKLLQGELGVKEITAKAEEYNYESGLGGFCILTVQIDTFAETRFRETDRDLLMFAVNNIVSEVIPGQMRLDPVVIGGNQVTILKSALMSSEERKNQAYEWAEAIQRLVKDILELSVSVGISYFHDRLADVSEAYRESLEALKYRIRFGEEAILYIGDVLPGQRVHAIFPEWMEKQLIEALMVPDLDKAGQLLHELLTSTVQKNLHHQEFHMILVRLLADLTREMQNAGEVLPVQDADHRDLFEQIALLRTVPDTEHWFMKNVMEPMVAQMSKTWEARNQNISHQMKDIIHTEFERELTLDVCATRLSYHPNYLKTVFRKETGVNFSDYLSQYRMNQAKKWLIETDMKIAMIAERLQYQNAQNFIRYFRKIENMTPGQYRKKYRSV